MSDTTEVDIATRRRLALEGFLLANIELFRPRDDELPEDEDPSNESASVMSGAVLIVRYSAVDVDDGETCERIAVVPTPGLGWSARLGMLQWAQS